MTRWLILVHRIPPRPLYLRAKIRQRLSGVGAVAVKNAVYLLPRSAESLEDLQWIAQEIVAGGGDAHLFAGDFVDAAASEAALAQFHTARKEDYDVVTAAARSATPSRRSATAAGDLAETLAKLSRRMEEIRRIDFFASPARAAAQQAIAAAEKRLRAERKDETRMLKAHPDLRSRTWVTRPGVKVDRMAAAWFIRRFIDPKARFRFADPASPRRQKELRFDMVGGDFTHEEDRCTLETLIRRVGLPDRAVGAVAEIVHDLDLKDGKYGRPETSGVEIMIDGIVRRTSSDRERIERALLLFDDLHIALGRQGRRSKKGQT